MATIEDILTAGVGPFFE